MGYKKLSKLVAKLLAIIKKQMIVSDEENKKLLGEIEENLY